MNDLKESIKAELLRPDDTVASVGSPVIFKDTSGLRNHSHYYVVWDKFDGVDSLERTLIIYESIEEVLGIEEAFRAVTTMGLTVKEAKNRGIEV